MFILGLSQMEWVVVNDFGIKWLVLLMGQNHFKVSVLVFIADT